MLPLAGVAQAVEVRVTAEFAPSALNPSRNEFTNTTPPGTYCSWRPQVCREAGAYFVDVPLNMTKTYIKGGDVRKRFFVGLPAARTTEIVHDGTGASYPVNISFLAVSGELSPAGPTNPVFTVYVRGGCSYVYTGAVGTWTRFGWQVQSPTTPSPCHSEGQAGEVGFTQTYEIRWLGLGMKITSPAPLSLPSGNYRGKISYTLGSLGSDIDLGDGVSGDSEVTFQLDFTVKHEFQAIFPSDSPRVVLVPEGGWPQWTDHGRLPARMRQELPFVLTSSTEFSMKLRCEHDAGDRCGIRNLADATVVPIDVDVTMPGMANVVDHRPAQNTPLLVDDARAPRFEPDGYLMDRRSWLRFTAGRDAVAEMFKAPGSRWEGNITVVFDADP